VLSKTGVRISPYPKREHDASMIPSSACQRTD